MFTFLSTQTFTVKSKLRFMINVEIQAKWYFSLWDLMNIWGFKNLKFWWFLCWLEEEERVDSLSLPSTQRVPQFFCPICWMFTRTPAHCLLCTLVFLTLWFRSNGCDDIPLWLNLDPPIHQTVQICPVLSLFYFILFIFTIFFTYLHYNFYVLIFVSLVF